MHHAQGESYHELWNVALKLESQQRLFSELGVGSRQDRVHAMYSLTEADKKQESERVQENHCRAFKPEVPWRHLGNEPKKNKGGKNSTKDTKEEPKRF